jgi:hypothetical protein
MTLLAFTIYHSVVAMVFFHTFADASLWVSIPAFIGAGYLGICIYSTECEVKKDLRDLRQAKKDLAKECTLQDCKIKRLMEYIELMES